VTPPIVEAGPDVSDQQPPTAVPELPFTDEHAPRATDVVENETAEADHTLSVATRIGKILHIEQFGNVGKAAGEDIFESDKKIKRSTVALGALAVQVADRLRVAVTVVPPLATHILTHTGSPTEAALAAGAAFGAYSFAVGTATTEGLKQFPSTVASVSENFPGFVGAVQDALPGLEPPTQEQRRAPLPERIKRRFGTGFARGTSDIALGTTAYVSTAAAQGKNRKEIYKLNGRVSLDGGIMVGGIVFGIGEVIETLGHRTEAWAQHLAENIQNVATNMDTWYGTAGALILINLCLTRYDKTERGQRAKIIRDAKKLEKIEVRTEKLEVKAAERVEKLEVKTVRKAEKHDAKQQRKAVRAQQLKLKQDSKTVI
jgi:hypothetical protein